MRRSERELRDPAEIDAIIARCDCCRVGLRDGEEVYIVPMNFGYVHEGARRVFYFHSAAEGRKLCLIAQGAHAAFELDCAHALMEGDRACEYSFYYESVMGTGEISPVTEEKERALALETILHHYAPDARAAFDPKIFRATAILRLEVTQISAKAHRARAGGSI